MAKINPKDMRLINTSEDVIESYCCSGEDAMIGTEVELCFFDPESQDLAMMSPEQNEVAMAASVVAYPAGSFNHEPASDLLEANSAPGFFDDLQPVFDDIAAKMRTLTQESARLGLKRSYFQGLPHVSAQTFLDNIVNVERYQAFFDPPRADMMDIAAYFTVTKSTQVSISYKDYEHMHRNVRQLYLLAPFLFLMSDNGAGFDEGQRFTGHAGMRHREALEGRGRFPPYIFSAENGEQYIGAHIDHVMHNRMYVYYDADGVLQRLPSGTWWNFEKDLKPRGLNTVANYYLSQSILWPDVKLASLRDADGNVSQHRYEARMFGVGMHQAQTALLITGALGFDDDFAEKVGGLLRDYGMCLNEAPVCIEALTRNYEAAQNHGGKFFDIAYGKGTMTDFARDFGTLLGASKAATLYPDQIVPALDICESGWPDGRVNQALFADLDAVKGHLRDHDGALFDNPNQNARMVFGDGLRDAA